MSRFSVLLLVLGALFAPVGCSSTDVTGNTGTGPGSKALLSDDPSCKVDSDCSQGEQCLEGICQIQRCAAQNYRSASPLGKRSYFAVDRELIVVDDATSTRGIDGYEATGGSFAHPSSLRLEFGTARIVDEAAGNFTGSRPEGIAVILEGKSGITVAAGKDRIEIPLGFAPVALAAGDVEGDGTDEVAALSAAGDVAVCVVATKTCTRQNVGGLGKDLAMADVDGDGHDEPIVLADKSGSSHLYVVNLDAEQTGQPAIVDVNTGHTGMRVAAADLDHQPPAEIVVLEDGGYLGLAGDTLRVFGQKATNLTELAAHTVAKDTVDVFAGDTDGDDKAELLLLEKSGLEVFDASGVTELRPMFKTTLTSTVTPSRLALADLDGDSPVGTLDGDPALVAGPVVPMSVLVYPPYSRTHSDGTSDIGVGSGESKTNTTTTTVTLRASASVGFDVEFPAIAKVGISVGVEGAIARTSSTAQTISIGDSFSVTARPDLEGPDNGVAVLACACFHAYTYSVDDPAGKLGDRGADKKKMSLFVPVGGQTALWSLKRYNVLASKVQNLPILKVPYAVGDPTSYPTKMETLARKPIPQGDLVYTTPRAYRTSDVARVGWQLGTSEATTATEAVTVGVSLRGSLSIGPIYSEANVGLSKTDAYSVTVGRDASFSGSVPPVRNDVTTPEDENALYSYGFSPVVYRDRYKTKSGTEGGLFVVTYSVTR